jgi:hypothetical protein
VIERRVHQPSVNNGYHIVTIATNHTTHTAKTVQVNVTSLRLIAIVIPISAGLAEAMPDGLQ